MRKTPSIVAVAFLYVSLFLVIVSAYDPPISTEIPAVAGKALINSADSFGDFAVIDSDLDSRGNHCINVSNTTTIVAKLGLSDYEYDENETEKCFFWLSAQSFDGKFSKVWIVNGPSDGSKYYQISIPPMVGFEEGVVQAFYIEKAMSGKRAGRVIEVETILYDIILK